MNKTNLTLTKEDAEVLMSNNADKNRERQVILNEELTKITGVKHYPSVEEMFEAKFDEENTNLVKDEDGK